MSVLPRRSSRGEVASASGSPLRVLFVGHRFPPDGAGGYELHCASLRRHLESRGHTVEVLVGARDFAHGARDPAVRRSLRWKAQDLQLDRDSAWEFERHNRAELEAVLDSFAPDVVVWWRLAESSMSLVEVVRERGLPALGIVGDGWLHEGRDRDPWDPYRVEPLDYSEAGPWVFNSHWLRRRTVRAGIPLARTAVLSPGVDLTLFRPGPRRPWSGRLLYAGRLSTAKGVDVAVDAVAQLPGFELTIVGDGDAAYVTDLERRAASLGVAERVRVKPAVGRCELAEHYRAADAVLFPVRWEEPLGLVPLEAMACGTPTVATGTGGSAEYLAHGRNALQVDREDPSDLARAVARLAANPRLRAALRTAGLATAAAHDGARSNVLLERLVVGEVRMARGRRPRGPLPDESPRPPHVAA